MYNNVSTRQYARKYGVHGMYVRGVRVSLYWFAFLATPAECLGRIIHAVFQVSSEHIS